MNNLEDYLNLSNCFKLLQKKERNVSIDTWFYNLKMILQTRLRILFKLCQIISNRRKEEIRKKVNWKFFHLPSMLYKLLWLSSLTRSKTINFPDRSFQTKLKFHRKLSENLSGTDSTVNSALTMHHEISRRQTLSNLSILENSRGRISSKNRSARADSTFLPSPSSSANLKTLFDKPRKTRNNTLWSLSNRRILFKGRDQRIPF